MMNSYPSMSSGLAGAAVGAGAAGACAGAGAGRKI